MTTAGPQTFPSYTVLDQNTGRLIGRVQRDPVNPHHWIATFPARPGQTGERIPFVDEKTRAAADAAVRDLDARNVI